MDLVVEAVHVLPVVDRLPVHLGAHGRERDASAADKWAAAKEMTCYIFVGGGTGPRPPRASFAAFNCRLFGCGQMGSALMGPLQKE